MNKILPSIFIIVFLTSCLKNYEPDKKKKILLLGFFLLSNKQTISSYFCDRKVTCRRYPTNYKTSYANYNCMFNATNFQYICTVTPLAVSGTGILTKYYSSKSDFIDESACIGLIKLTKYTYVGTSVDSNGNGTNANTTFTAQGYPLIYPDPGQGTATAESWDRIGRPLTTTPVSSQSCSAYIQYSYDDLNLKISADYVRPNGCSSPEYGPNERRFNQDYNEIQRNTFIQDSTGKITITENITINSTEEICK